MSKSRLIVNFSGNSKDYLKTFFTTLFIVVMFVVLNIFYMIHSIFNDDGTSKKNGADSVFESYLVDILIDKNVQFSRTYPKNYAVNMRLGVLYSYKKDYIAAEREFKNSIEKAVSTNFAPNYQLAKLYVKTNRLQEAQQVMDKIGEKPNKRLIKYKGDIYTLLGDAYYDDGYYALSVIKYDKAMSYYEVIKDKQKELKIVKDRFVKACIALADKYVEVGKIEEAIMALEKAFELKPKKVILNYKLGLLYMDEDPYKSYKLLSFVHKKSPLTLNYDVYSDLIYRLADIEEEKGNKTDAQLYRKKAMHYKKFVKNNLLYDKDLFLSLDKFDIHTDIAAEEYIINVQFTLQNNSSLDIENLSVRAVFKDGDKVVQTYTQKIFDETRIFEAGSVTPPILISASESYIDNNKQDDITVDIYAYKYPKYQIKLYSGSLKKTDVSY